MDGAIRSYGLDRSRLRFVGHSNGANFYTAFAALYPELAGDALLYRPMPVLETWPETDLSGRNFLLVAGERDKYRDKATELRDRISSGAQAGVEMVDDGHELGLADIEAARRWLAA